jgi:hypothetical protein
MKPMKRIVQRTPSASPYGVHESGYGEVIALDVGSRVLCTWASEIPSSLSRQASARPRPLPSDDLRFGIVGAHLR